MASEAIGGRKPMVVIVTGPTAVGKTKIGLELAKRLNGEVISADSVQVHTGLDVGSDKLPEAQRQGIKHHLIDVLPPTAEFSAGEFFELGRRAAEDIISRGKVPIVVGGTGFYLRWFMYGKAQTPQSSPELRDEAFRRIQRAWAEAAAVAAGAGSQAEEQAQQQAAGEQQQQAAGTSDDEDNGSDGTGCPLGRGEEPQGVEQQQRRLQQGQDAAAAAAMRRQWREQCRQQRRAAREAAPPTPQQLADRNMPPGAPPGLSREALWDTATGVVAQLGDPDSAARVRGERHNWYRLLRVCQVLLQNGGRPLSQMDVDTSREPDYDFRCFFLHRPRMQLYDKIALRVEEMVAGGLLREARGLMDLGVSAGSCNASRAIGYRQALDFLEEARRQGRRATREQLLALLSKIGAATRRLVKGQHTWFRDDDAFKWVDNTAPEEEVLGAILAELAKPQHEGGCGDSGRLDKDEARAMREYVQPVVLFKDTALVERTLDEVQRLLGGNGGGGGDGDGGGGGGGDCASVDGQGSREVVATTTSEADVVKEQQPHVPPL